MSPAAPATVTTAPERPSASFAYPLAAGTMRVAIDPTSAWTDPATVFDVAGRINRKRGFLIVSRLIGRHLPTRPSAMRATMARLAGLLPPLGEGPVVFIGMAETAVGLGQGVHAAWSALHAAPALFLSTTRQTCAEMPQLLRFEETHSHASTHLLHCPADPADAALLAQATTLVLVDDEASTGLTMDALERALGPHMPRRERTFQLAIADWSRSANPHRLSLMSGTLDWEPAGDLALPGEAATPAAINRPGMTRPGASAARTAYRHLSRAIPALPDLGAPKRVLVLADGENGYDALLVAERLEALGHAASLQSITRSPAAIGGAIGSRHAFSDSHGSGASCWSYNLFLSAPEAVVCVTERARDQAAELGAACAGQDIAIHVVEVSQ